MFFVLCISVKNYMRHHQPRDMYATQSFMYICKQLHILHIYNYIYMYIIYIYISDFFNNRF